MLPSVNSDGPVSLTNAVLVVGASGFIGTRLVKSLRAKGERVVAVDISPPRVYIQDVEYLAWDVRTRAPENLRYRFARIYNLAAVHRTPGHKADEYYNSNILGAINVTELAESLGTPLIVFTSSISVYGPSEDQMSESSGINPSSAYGRSKRISEVVHADWAQRGIERKLIIIRPAVIFGPGENGNYTSLVKALSRGIFFYPGRRDTVKSGGYVDELLRAIEFSISHSDALILFNFAYPKRSSTQHIVELLSKISGAQAHHATLPSAALYFAAAILEFANAIGLKNSVHRERVRKLTQSTWIHPGWLCSQGFIFETDLETALIAWRDETNGSFS